MDSPTVSEEVARRVIGSLGFPRARVDEAVACLLGQSSAPKHILPVDRVLSFKETWQVLSLSKSGLRRLINSGEIKPIRLTKNRIGFRTHDINAFIANKGA